MIFSRTLRAKEIVLITAAGLIGLSACSKKDKGSGTVLAAPPVEVLNDSIDSISTESLNEQSEKIETIIREHDLYHYPTITAYLFIKNADRTSEKILAANGEILYNPNLSGGSQIKFLIANIPPRKLLDKDFLSSLDLRAIEIENPKQARYSLPKAETEKSLIAANDTVTVPIHDINIDKLESEKNGGKLLGEGITVAVIDSGIDASHPVFQDRVVFWSDETEETQVALESIEDSAATITLKLNGKDQKLKVPEKLIGKNIYVGVIREKALGAQVDFDKKRSGEDFGLDLNLDEVIDGEFAIVVGEEEEDQGYVAYVDTSGNGKFSEGKELKAIVDFNTKRNSDDEAKYKDIEEFVEFQFRTRSIKYPLLILKNKEGQPKAIRLGVTDGSHGTHVAGIIGANGLGIKGAAPQAKFMALKVCSGISCTTDAILRGLLKAFYNPQGLVPDVVNISLGSHQQYSQDVMDFLIQDLTAKFGTVFVVSASNSGPGYRSLNSIASFGPTIQVGAHASKETLEKLYTLDKSVSKNMLKNQLLFFSSVGPSFTGHLRPNLIAPGAALSSTALSDNGVDMYNGTSMSSPIVAGTVAALLSVAKEDPRYATTLAYRQAKIDSVFAEAAGEGTALPYSLKGHAIAIRTALEDTVTPLKYSIDHPQYTMAQQGHGLVNALKAYDELVRLSAMQAEGEINFFDVTLNDNTKSGALYQRNGTPLRSVEVSVALVEDAEMSEEERLTIKTLPITIELKRVDEQGPDGKITTLIGELPFALAARGAEGQDSKTATILLGSSRRVAFVSLRKTQLMTPGKTYLAHYAMYQKGVRIQSLLDVVHVPVELQQTEQVYDLPALDTETFKARNAFAVRSAEIGANEFHRYPVAVTAEDTELSVEIGIPHGIDGALFLQLYDPDGKEVEFKVAHRSSELDPGVSPKAKITAVTAGKPGIYEATVAASYWRRYSATSYDLLIRADRLNINKKILNLKKGSNTEVLRISHPYASISSIKGEEVSLEAAELLNVKTVPGLWSYHKIKVPQDAAAITVELSPSASDDLMFFGSIVPQLFSDVQNGNPTPIGSAIGALSTNTSAYFAAEDLGEDVYFAIENFGVLKENGSLSPSTEVPIRVVYEGTEAGTVKVIKSSSSSAHEVLLQIVAPETLLNSSAGVGSLSIKAGGKNLNVDITVK